MSENRSERNELCENDVCSTSTNSTGGSQFDVDNMISVSVQSHVYVIDHGVAYLTHSFAAEQSSASRMTSIRRAV